MDVGMFKGWEDVYVRRGGEEHLISLLKVRADDEVKHSGMWWQLCTSRTPFGQVEHGRPFAHQHQWYVVDKDGSEPLVQKLVPNAPFGEASKLRVRLPFLATSDVDLLGLKLAGRCE